MSKLLDSLLPCPCGNQAELHEWEEIDATRWAARAKCNCGWEGPIGYADNHRGCFDAVNDLHKKRAIAAWNKRAPNAAATSDSAAWGASTWADLHTALDGAHELSGAPHERINELIRQRDEARAAASTSGKRANLDAALKVFEQAACKEAYKMRDGVAAVLRYAQQAEIDPLSPEGQRLLYERSPSEGKAVPYVERFSESSGEGGGVYPDETGDFVRYSAFVELHESSQRSDILEKIDMKAVEGMDTISHEGALAALEEIREMIVDHKEGVK